MMRTVYSISFLLVLCFAAVNMSLAGLVDYDRLNRIGARKALSGSYGDNVDEKELPGWFKVEPKVTMEEERVYDSNRDGKLQRAEVKILLRDFIDIVYEKNGAMYKSLILKEYDRNRDGLINKYEAEEIDKQVR